MLDYITAETGITLEQNQRDLRDIFKALHILKQISKRNKKSNNDYPAKGKSYGSLCGAVKELRRLVTIMTQVDPYAGPDIGHKRILYKRGNEYHDIVRFSGSISNWSRYSSYSYWYQSVLEHLKNNSCLPKNKRDWFYDKEAKELRSFDDYILWEDKAYSKEEYFQPKNYEGTDLRPVRKDKCISMGGPYNEPFIVPDGAEFISDPQDLEDITKGTEFSIKIAGYCPSREFNLFPFTYKGKHIRFGSLKGGIISIDFKNLRHLDFKPTKEWLEAVRKIRYGTYYAFVSSADDTLAYIAFNYKKRNQIVSWLKSAFGRTRASAQMPISTKRMMLLFDVMKKMFKVLDKAEVTL